MQHLEQVPEVRRANERRVPAENEHALERAGCSIERDARRVTRTAWLALNDGRDAPIREGERGVFLDGALTVLAHDDDDLFRTRLDCSGDRIVNERSTSNGVEHLGQATLHALAATRRENYGKKPWHRI